MALGRRPSRFNSKHAMSQCRTKTKQQAVLKQDCLPKQILRLILYLLENRCGGSFVLASVSTIGSKFFLLLSANYLRLELLLPFLVRESNKNTFVSSEMEGKRNQNNCFSNFTFVPGPSCILLYYLGRIGEQI